jgi:Predicted Zn-dependent protease (DUF2268)
MKSFWLLVLLLATHLSQAQNTDPRKTQIVTADLDNFWLAFEKAKPGFDPSVFQTYYIDKGSRGVNDFMKGRIQSAENLAKVVGTHVDYYSSIKVNTDSISGMKDEIISSLEKLKALYPPAIFPPVYFVIGALNSGGTSSNRGLIIGAEMYGLTSATPNHELNDWLKTVIQPVNRVPHIVAHELIHFQQKYDGGNLLSACIKEGAADFMAELISGKHINQHVHDFANPREKELWLEFKGRMHQSDYTGWLYSSAEGRPNDLGYWMGYQITKAYYEEMTDKKKAIKDIMTIRDFDEFLRLSNYSKKFD